MRSCHQLARLVQIAQDVDVNRHVVQEACKDEHVDVVPRQHIDRCFDTLCLEDVLWTVVIHRIQKELACKPHPQAKDDAKECKHFNLEEDEERDDIVVLEAARDTPALDCYLATLRNKYQVEKEQGHFDSVPLV